MAESAKSKGLVLDEDEAAIREMLGWFEVEVRLLPEAVRADAGAAFEPLNRFLERFAWTRFESETVAAVLPDRRNIARVQRAVASLLKTSGVTSLEFLGRRTGTEPAAIEAAVATLRRITTYREPKSEIKAFTPPKAKRGRRPSTDGRWLTEATKALLRAHKIGGTGARAARVSSAMREAAGLHAVSNALDLGRSRNRKR